jgi:transcriptional regulator with XRE-family HTH domain
MIVTQLTLGKLLKQARESKDMTTTFVALRVDIKPSLLIMVEKGEKYPTPDYFADLCRLLDLDVQKAWMLLKREKEKLYEQRLSREYRISANLGDNNGRESKSGRASNTTDKEVERDRV